MERVDLPSGRSVPLLSSADPERPWEPWGSNGTFHVRRAHRGDSTAWDYYGANRDLPFALSEEDAKALAIVLNSRRRQRRAVPPATLTGVNGGD
jgi:hypothetical protein